MSDIWKHDPYVGNSQQPCRTAVVEDEKHQVRERVLEELLKGATVVFQPCDWLANMGAVRVLWAGSVAANGTALPVVRSKM